MLWSVVVKVVKQLSELQSCLVWRVMNKQDDGFVWESNFTRMSFHVSWYDGYLGTEVTQAEVGFVVAQLLELSRVLPRLFCLPDEHNLFQKQPNQALSIRSVGEGGSFILCALAWCGWSCLVSSQCFSLTSTLW